MNASTVTGSVATIAADALVVGSFCDQGLSGPARDVDRAAGGALSKLVERKEITGKAYELTPLHLLPGVSAPLVLVVGCGKKGELDRGQTFRVAAAAARWLSEKPRERVAFYLEDALPAGLVESGVAGATVGCHGQDLYRSERKRNPFGQLLWWTPENRAVAHGSVVGQAMNLTRKLVNEPPDRKYPEALAAQAVEVAGSCGLEVEVWDEGRLEQERCGALLAVARGSSRPPRLVQLRYCAADRDSVPWLALAGKGVTFDSGGLSLKPTEHMQAMKCDMAGAATVLGAIQAIAQLKLPVNVMALMGLVENMPGASAYKLGDVLTARNGRTIEVHNTDAEGRLVLADVLAVAVDHGAARIIDLATLTGACMVALGTDVTGVMTNDQTWCESLLSAARECGEPVWQLPMFPEYADQIRGEVADIKNVGEGRYAGAITAAKFLEEFVGGKPWTHCDIAGPAFQEKPKPWHDAGGTGALLRTLVEVAHRISDLAHD